MNSAREKRQFKESPEQHANFISKFLFWWIKDIYKLGTKGILKAKDIYQIKSELKSKRITEQFIQLWADEMKRENPSLLRLLCKRYGASVMFWGMCYSALDIAMRISHSLCLGGLVDFFSQKEPNMSTNAGLLYACGLCVSLAVSAVTCHPYMIFVENIASQIKIGLTGLVYRKVLRFPLSSVYDSLNGKVLNIMADDVNQFDQTLQYLHHAWKGPCESIIFGYFIYREIGVAGMVGFSVLLCFMPLQAYLARKATLLQIELSKQTDQRIKIMNETIIGIRVIKMFGLEHVFGNVIKKVRSKEIVIIQSLYRIRAVLVSLSLLTRISIFVSLVTFLHLGNEITPRNMFITFALFNLLNWSMLWQWPFALIYYGQGYVAMKRMQAFMLNEEMNASIEPGKGDGPSNRIIFEKHETKAINLTNITSKWISGSNRVAGILNSSLTIGSGELCAIIGPVGSGKSSLLHVITGELNIKAGHCEVYGKISYASQMPWIFEGTVRQNIVFTETYDDEKFRRVVRVCCLDKEIDRMPHEDLTMVGECGFTLSGGQSSRINLARAIYRNADIYILDDTLASLDFKIGKYIVQHCIQEYLAGKTRIIVTNELQYFKYAPHLVAMLDGRIQAEGTFEEIQNRGFLSFWNLKTSDITTTDDEILAQKSLTSVLTILDDDNYHVNRTEKQFEGSRIDVYKFYFSSIRSVQFLVLIVFLFILSQSLSSGVDFYISNWNVGTNWEMMVSASKIKTFNSPTENSDDDGINSVYISTYFGLMAATTVATLYRTFGFFELCLSASIALHNDLFASVMRAKMEFFNSNASGRILNRFSKDLLNIESKLAQALIEFVIFTLELIASIVMVSIIVNFWMLIPSAAIAIFFCALRYVFTNTAQCVERIEAISLSPLYSYVNNTRQGLSTIRISNVETKLQEEFYEHLDFNTAVTYLKSMTSRAFSAWIDGVCLLYIGICSLTFVWYRGNVDGPLLNLDEFFSFQNDSPNIELQNVTNTQNADNILEESIINLKDFFVVENTTSDDDPPNILDEAIINNGTENENVTGLDEIVRAVKVKEPNKRVSARVQREKGSAYLGYSRVGSKVAQNIERPARQQGPYCSSQFCTKSSLRHCNLFKEHERKELFDKFWRMNWPQKQMYICQLIEAKFTKDIEHDEQSPRDPKKYFLESANGKRIQVCHQMFLNTFGLKEKMVRQWLKHKGKYGLRENPLEVQKRKCTKKQQSETYQAILDRKLRLLSFLIDYPKLESHYCRKDTGKEYIQTSHQTLIDLYKEYVCVCKHEKSLQLSFPVFSGTLKNLNYCLFKPRKDQCDTCIKYKVGNLCLDGFKNHRDNVDRASKEKERDVKAAKMKLFHLLCMDAEGVVLCPKLLASALYFKSKLQLHNFTIYDILTHDSANYVWDETEGDLQSSIFTSIVVHHLKKVLDSDSLPITIYSDGCGYQNRNVVLANALRLLAVKYSRTITQKFLEVGHTHMECDSTHACIERKSKGLTFNLPSDFEMAIKTARDRPFPFVVEHLTHTFFRNFDDKDYLTIQSIRPGKKPGDPKVNDIRCLQYTPEGEILFKLNFDDDFKLLPQPTTNQSILEPRVLHDNRLQVSSSKWKHLQELKEVLPLDSHSFYDNIPHREEPTKIVTETEKLQNLMEKVKLVKVTRKTKNVKGKATRKNASNNKK